MPLNKGALAVRLGRAGGLFKRVRLAEKKARRAARSAAATAASNVARAAAANVARAAAANVARAAAAARAAEEVPALKDQREVEAVAQKKKVAAGVKNAERAVHKHTITRIQKRLARKKVREEEKAKKDEERGIKVGPCTQKQLDKLNGFTKVHYIGERTPCKHGCGAEVWPGEANLCCKSGKHILNVDCNPPLDAAYLDLITQPRYSQQSRALNGGLAMASQGIYPSKALGGVGWHEQAYGHLALFGKTYLTMRDLGSNNSFDTYMLPEDILLDGARHDVGEDYAQHLLQTRRYLEKHHPLALHLHAVADVPGAFVDGNPFMRLEAGADNGKMELAMVSSGVRHPDEAAHKVLIFDLRVHAAGLAPLAPKNITRHSAMYGIYPSKALGAGGRGVARAGL